MSFADIDLHPLIQKALAAEGYADPTPVQVATIPPAVAGRDVLATAHTGTGKTAAFLLPSLNRLAGGRVPRPAGLPRILVLAPTRELARQVLLAARKLGKFLNLNTVELVGGMPYRDQLRLLSRPVDVVVATPGRLRDHLQRGRLDLGGVEVLILDEADRMLDLGFLEDVEAIAAACGTARQTLLFTATWDQRMAKIAERLLSDPVRVAIEHGESPARIDQRVHHADDLAHKRRLLHHFAASADVAKAIVFTATKRDADTLAQGLVQAGHAAAALHGDMTQGERNRTLDKLRAGTVRMLVATDVAARGIDVRDVTHVINFDLPRAPEDYVHRIGRTGRAGAQGIAISFVGPADRGVLPRIQHYTKAAIDVHVVPGLEPRRPVAAADRAVRRFGKERPKPSNPSGKAARPGQRADVARQGRGAAKPLGGKPAAAGAGRK
ncbi:MAG: DEAD/DEAH box helicase [Magnetospirillum sp.]|nr:DEAD/DEAH box helicase [Magnetospirillum sp.]